MTRNKKLRLQTLLLTLVFGFLCLLIVNPAIAHAASNIELNTFYTDRGNQGRLYKGD